MAGSLLNKVLAAVLALGLGAFSLAPQAHAASERDAMLDRGLRNNGPYASSLARKAEQLKGEERNAALKQAVAYSADTPSLYFRQAAAAFPDMAQSAIYAVDGFKAYGRSFWWQMSLKGLLLVSLLFSVLLSGIIIALMRLPAELPRLVHDINESKAKLIIPLILLPAAVLGPVVLTVALLMLSGLYMAKSGKWIVYILMILTSCVPLIGKVADVFYSASSPVVRAIVDVNEGRENMGALLVLRGRKDFASRFSYATALKREGGAEEAVRLFKGIIADNPDPKAMINLGNAYFASGDSDKAKEAYKKALEADKSVLVLYNLSQVFRDSFEYAVGDKYYEEAQAMDSQALSDFQQVHGKNYNRKVIDARLTADEIVQAASEDERRALPLAGDYNRTAAGGVALLILFAILDSAIKHRSYRCSKCNRLACDQCSDPRQQGEPMCSECLKAQAGEDTSAKARLARMLQANEDKARMVTRLRVFSVFPPGFAQTYSGRVGKAFFFMVFFIFPGVALVLDPYFTTGLEGGGHDWLMLAALPIMALVYLISFITVNRRLDRGWL